MYKKALITLSLPLFAVGCSTKPQTQIQTPSLLETERSHPLNQIQKTPVLQPSSSIPGWENYQNEQLGFAMSYPSNWSPSNLIYKGRQYGVRFGNYESDANIKAQDPLASIYVEVINNEENISFTEQGQKGKSTILSNIVWETYFFPHENPGELGDFRPTLVLVSQHQGKYYLIRLVENNSLSIGAEFLLILSTFNFTD